MKKIFLLSIFLLSLSVLKSQNYYMTSPEGFGAATTGGGNATPVMVTTYTDLKAKLQLTTPQVILVSGTITLSSGQQISLKINNKTIIGLPGARLINNTQTQAGSGILNLKSGSSNVIIRNLIFEGPGAYDVDGRDNLTSEGCVNLWVDHCEFQDGTDGNFDIKNTSDNVTVSWCKFTYLKPPVPGGPGGSNDHRFSNLIGSSSSDAPADGHYSVTFQNCYWAAGCKDRMPRSRNGELHILNCYYNTAGVSNSNALGLGGGINNLTCYVENTNFEYVGSVFKNYISSDGGTVNLTYDGCISTKSFYNIGSVSKPTYSYTVMPVNDVASVVSDASCGAGATLQVTPDGTMSSSCDSLGVEENVLANGINFYPTLVDNVVTIDFSNGLTGTAKINIYSITGQKVLTVQKNISANKMSLNLSGLTSGFYICQLNLNGVSTSKKLIKK